MCVSGVIGIIIENLMITVFLKSIAYIMDFEFSKCELFNIKILEKYILSLLLTFSDYYIATSLNEGNRSLWGFEFLFVCLPVKLKD